MSASREFSIEVVAPACITAEWLDEERLGTLSPDQRQRVSDDDGLSAPDVVRQFGVRFLKDSPWLIVRRGDDVVWQLSSRSIVSQLCPSGDFEGLEALRVGPVVVVAVVVASGQAGGVSVHDLESGEAWFTASDFVPGSFFWAEELGVLWCLEEVWSYSGGSISLLAVAHERHSQPVTLFASRHPLSKDAVQPYPAVPPYGCPLTREESEERSETSPFVYDPESGDLLVHVTENGAGRRRNVTWRADGVALRDWMFRPS